MACYQGSQIVSILTSGTKIDCLVSLKHQYGFWSLPANCERTLCSNWPNVNFLYAENLDEEMKFAENAEIAFCWKLTNELYKRALKLKWVQLASSGTDKRLPVGFDLERVQLTTMKGAGARAAAEYALGVALSVSHKLFDSCKANYEAKWDRREFLDRGDPIKEANDLRVLILGLGKIGSSCAEIFSHMGYQVYGCSRREPLDPTRFRLKEFFHFDRLREALRLADFLIVSIPLTSETRNLIGTSEIQSMPDRSYIINLAREEIVSIQDALTAMKIGKLRGVSVDVPAQDPPDLEHLSGLTRNGIVMTPHIAAASTRYWSNAISIFETNLRAFLELRTS